MIKHIAQIYQTRDKLISVDEEINEKHHLALLLCSFPGSYDILTIALESRYEDEQTPKFID